MAFCPRCRGEYEPHVQSCVDCSVELVEALPAIDVEEADVTDARTVTVYVARNDSDAQNILHLLEQAEIPHQKGGSLSAAGYALTIGRFAEIPIRVLEDYADEARKLIADYTSAPPESP